MLNSKTELKRKKHIWKSGRSNKYEEDQDSPHLDMEKENLEMLSQSQLQQRTEANAWITSMANAMWEMRPRYNSDENKNENNNNE